MKGFRLGLCRAVAACTILVPFLGACAGQGAGLAPRSAARAEPERSAGGKIFDKWCSDCHSTPEGPGSMALQRRYQGAVPAILEQRSNLAPAYIKLAVRRGVSFMPSFRKTEIGDADLTLLADYLAHSQGQRRP